METKNIYFISGIDTDAGKAIAPPGTPVSLCNAACASSPKIHPDRQHRSFRGHRPAPPPHRNRLPAGRQRGADHARDILLSLLSPPRRPHRQAPDRLRKIERATRELSHRYDTVLVEGAGGLMVPLTEDFLTIDYIAEKQYPLIFVTSGKLGSINHTLLSFEAIKNRDIALDTVLYNLYPTVEDKTIQEDTMKYIKQYLSKHFPGTKFEVVPEIV